MIHKKSIANLYQQTDHLGKGIRKARFRNLNMGVVKNRYFYAICLAKDIKFSEVAELVNKSSRSVYAHVYEGSIPINIEVFEAVLGYERNILFNDSDIHDESTDLVPKGLHKRILDRKDTKYEILYGLMILYGLTAAELNSHINISKSSTSNYLYGKVEPSPEVKKKFCKFFNCPEHILFRTKA